MIIIIITAWHGISDIIDLKLKVPGSPQMNVNFYLIYDWLASMNPHHLSALAQTTKYI